MLHHTRRRQAPGAGLRVVALGLMLAAWAGCGGGSPPAVAPEDQAREVLNNALAGWQRGDSIEDLKQASPSILASDPKWSQGARLSKFEVKGDGKPAGAERVFTVTLWLGEEPGQEVSETVEYKVGTSPVLTVFRSLF